MSIRKKTMLTRLATLVMIVLMSISAVIPAFAADVNTIESTYNGLSVESKAKVTFDSGSNELDVDGTTITAYASKSAAGGVSLASVTLRGGIGTIFLEDAETNSLLTALTSLKDAEAAVAGDKSVAGVKGKINDISKGMGIEAEISQAYGALSGLKETLGVGLGLVTYAIMMFLTVFTCLDIAFIVIPPFRVLCSDKAQQGGGGTSTNKNTGEAKMRFISDEAMYAVQQATIESGRSAIWIYTWKRIGGIVVVGIAIYLLLTGNISLIMNLALTLVSGVIDVLYQLSGATM